MGHNSRDCLSCPRKIGAKFSGTNILPDDNIQTINLSQFESKRDRWNGYDVDQYSTIVSHYDKIELNRRVFKKQASPKSKILYYDKHEDVEGDEEQLNFDKVEKSANMILGRSTATVRNLRIREDKVKYLY